MKLIKLTYLNTNIGQKEIKKFIYPVHFVEIAGQIIPVTIFIRNSISAGGNREDMISSCKINKSEIEKLI